VTLDIFIYPLKNKLEGKHMSKQVLDYAQLLSQPKVKVLETNFADMKAGQTMVVPTTELIRYTIEAMSEGESFSLSDLRQAMATRVTAEVACPVTTSIFLRKLIVTECSQYQPLPTGEPDNSIKAMLPFWRVVNPTMPLFKKLDLAIQSFILAQRKREGISRT
jgi:hypothetical protein